MIGEDWQYCCFLVDLKAIEDHPQFDLSDETAGVFLGKGEVAIHVDIKNPTTCWSQFPGLDQVLVMGQDFFCQPDSFWQEVSKTAVNDLDSHESSGLWLTLDQVHSISQESKR